jgi:hypothetical protein
LFLLIGIHVLNDSRILSTSLDQRLNLWEINFYDQEIKKDNSKNEIDKRNEFNLIKSEFVDVCDPSSMNILNITDNIVYVTIVGIGIEIFKYEYIQRYTQK